MNWEIQRGELVGLGVAEELSEKERNLIEFIRGLKYGELIIKVQDGLPVMIEQVTSKIKL